MGSAALAKGRIAAVLDRAEANEAKLLKLALPLETAIALVDYHARRNKIAKTSHDKSWYARHKGVKFLLL